MIEVIPDKIDCDDPLVEESPLPEQLIFADLKTKSKEKGFAYSIQRFQGKRGRGNEYYPHVSVNVFTKYPKKIPPHAREKKMDPALIKEYFSDPDKKKTVLLQKKPPGYSHAPFYFIHDNGGRPFLVYVNNNKNVAIYTFQDKNHYLSEKDYRKYGGNSENWKFFSIQLFEFKGVQRVFLGDDPDCDSECASQTSDWFSNGRFHSLNFYGISVMLTSCVIWS